MNEYLVWYGNGDDITDGWRTVSPNARAAATRFVKVKGWSAHDVWVHDVDTGEEVFFEDHDMFREWEKA